MYNVVHFCFAAHLVPPLLPPLYSDSHSCSTGGKKGAGANKTKPKILTMWVPVTDVSCENGCM